MEEFLELNMTGKESVNIYDWKALSCHDRALAIVAENIYTNTSACFVLFKFMGRDYLKRTYQDAIGDDKYYEFVSTLAHIEILEVLDESDDMKKTLIEKIRNDEKIVLIANNMYDNESFSYQKEDHPHFLVLKGYDYNSDSFLLIDEDYSKKYWLAQNSKYGVKYIDKRMDAEKLIKMCSHVKTFGRYKDINSEFKFAYYKVAPRKEPFKIESLYQLYREQLQFRVNNKNSLLSLYLDILYNYKEKIGTEIDTILRAASEKIKYINGNGMTFGEILQQNKKNNVSLAMKIPGWFVYPNESQVIGIHHHNIYADYVYWSRVKNETEGGLFLIESLNKLLTHYNDMQVQVTYAILQRSKEDFEEVIKNFRKIYTKEIQLYEDILSKYNILTF